MTPVTTMTPADAAEPANRTEPPGGAPAGTVVQILAITWTAVRDRRVLVATVAGLLVAMGAGHGVAPLVGLPVLVVAGLLVGFGSRLANGCTSGHGVCGVSRLAPRGLAATFTYLGFGVVGVLIGRALGVAP